MGVSALDKLLKSMNMNSIEGDSKVRKSYDRWNVYRRLNGLIELTEKEFYIAHIRLQKQYERDQQIFSQENIIPRKYEEYINKYIMAPIGKIPSGLMLYQ